MRRIYLIIALLSFFISCKPGIPEDIIQPQKMQKVLIDMHYVDGYLMTIYNPDSAKLLAAKYYNGLYEKYAIDSASYAQSMDYYYANPEILNKLYIEVDKVLQQRLKELNKSNQDAIPE